MHPIPPIPPFVNDVARHITATITFLGDLIDSDPKRCYNLGVNAYVVKPVAFREFIDAVKHIGIFWAMLNELPPTT